MALTNKLTAIGDAIRTKTGETKKYTLDEIAQVISEMQGNARLPEQLINYSGDCSYRFFKSSWDWVIENYGSQIKTSDITGAGAMFSQSKIESIPFDLNFKSDTYCTCSRMFSECMNLKSIGNMNNLKSYAFNSMFANCNNLRELPNFKNISFSEYGDSQCENMFQKCFSLRSIPEYLLKQMLYSNREGLSPRFNQMFNDCYCLDQIVGFNPHFCSNETENWFFMVFDYCFRLKNLIFATQDNGTVYTCNYSGQFIDLTNYVGYSSTGNKPYFFKYNSGITMDKEVTDANTYNSLKNDPDWFTCNIAYSRYNHDSAVATINSLPDTSAYLAENGGTNTIKFKGASGSSTDGGAISNLTAEEIAVATSKGWTVTLV